MSARPAHAPADSQGVSPPPRRLIGALLRVPWEAVRERMLRGLHEDGFDDLVAAHLNVLQYPGPENRRPSDLAAETRMSKQAMNYLLGQMELLGYIERRDGGKADRDWLGQGRYQVAIGGERYDADLSRRPPYDPAGTRIRG